MNRRNFMKALGGAGLATVIPGLLPGTVLRDAHAADAFTGKLLLTIHVGGGWDQSSFFDPRENTEVNHWAANAPAAQAGNIRAAGWGENAAFIAKYFNNMLVFNGVDLQTNGHSSADRTQASGALSGLPNTNALYGAIHGDGLPMPWLLSSGNDYNLGIQAFTRLPGTTEMRQLADPNRRDTDRQYYRSSDLAIIDRFRRERAQAQADDPSALPFTRRKAGQMSVARSSRELMEQLAAALPDQVDSTDLAGDNHNRVSAMHRILVAMQAGVCVTANLRTGSSYDTHSDHDARHLNGVIHLTRLLDYTMSKAAALGLADRLIIHVASDVGRTPHYNSNNGKDHWSNGSSMIMASGQPWTNRVVGVSGPRHEKLNIDAETLQPNPDGVRLRTAHVQSTLRQILGIDSHPLVQQYPLAVPPIATLGSNSSPVNV